MKQSKKWTKEQIKDLLNTNDVAVVKGMIRIYELQTEDEKMSEDTHYDNGVGFTGADAFILSKFAVFFIERHYLTRKQFDLAKKKMMKYAGQLAKIANGDIHTPNRFSVIKFVVGWLRG